MGSTNFTEHYDIPLPLGSDKTTPMDYNPSMQAVDTALFEAQGNASDAKAGLVTTNQNVAQNAQNITALTGRVTTVEGTVSSQGTQLTNLGNKISSVEQDAQDMICAYNEASATASRNYAVGDYFIYNDVLYKATQEIASGATIVPDTNCTTTNVGAELKAHADDIDDIKVDVTALENEVNRGSYSKAYGGSSTYREVLNDFATHIDFLKISSNTKVTIENNTFNVVRHTASMVLVTCNLLDSSGIETMQAVIMTSGSQYAIAIGGGAPVDRSNSAISGEITVKIKY